MDLHVPCPQNDLFIRELTNCQAVLCGYCRAALGGPSEDAKDAWQRTNVTLWRKAAEWRPETDFLPWALAVARFEVLATVRDRQRELLAFDSDVINPHFPASGSFNGLHPKSKFPPVLAVKPMKPTPRLFLISTLASLAIGSTQAAILVHYGFETIEDGASPATLQAIGVSAGVLANNGAGNPLGGSPLGLFSASTYTGNHTNGTGINVGTGGTTAAGTGSGNVLSFRANAGQTLIQATTTSSGIPTSQEYFSFTLSGTVGNTLDLSSISFDFAKGGTGNDRGVVVWYSTDAFAGNAFALGNGSENSAVILSANTDQLARNVSYSLASLPDTVGSIEFRFYSTNASGNTIKLDNIIVEGVVVPEPGSLLLASLGMLGLLRRRR